MKYVRKIPLYTTEGVPDCEITTIPFQTEDELGLSFQRFHQSDSDDIVVIIHGLTTSTDMFIMPEHYNLVKFLHDHNYKDVWSLDFRMSNRFSYNLEPHRYNMDDIAMYDYPAALKTLREKVGPDKRIHIICHCLGSVSFTMSLFGKQVDGITSCIANSVSLTPRVPTWSNIKLRFAPFMVERIFNFAYMSPNWGFAPYLSTGKIFSKFVSLIHRECDNPACHMLSMMWGAGCPALYKHENLHDITHERGGDLYGGTSMNYYRQVLKMVKADNTAVKYLPDDPKYDNLPNDYFEYAAGIETPVLFMTGRENHIFTDSNIECHRRMEEIVPGRHELAVFDGYGHQDVFMGKNNDKDIFPRLVEFINKHSKVN
ncbi:alpha/beta fold hydrolase [Verrucomicrobiaceae bacterium 227]